MKKLTLLFIAALALTGCPGGDKNNNGNYYNQGLAGCVDCGLNAAVFSQSVSSQIPQANMTLVIAGDANQMNMWGSSGQNPLFAYQGPVRVTGTLDVTSLLPFGMCQLPLGHYTIGMRADMQSGIFNRGVFQVPAIELVGTTNGIRMIVSLAEGTILTDGNGTMVSFGAVLVGQQGPVLMGGGVALSSCADPIGVRF